MGVCDGMVGLWLVVVVDLSWWRVLGGRWRVVDSGFRVVGWLVGWDEVNCRWL